MDEKFKKYVDQLPSLFEELKKQSAKTLSEAKKIKKAGVYLFSEGSKHIYVGRSGNIGQRLSNQVGGASAASFACLLAYAQLGNPKATYTKEASREKLKETPEFISAFKKAKKRIEKMQVRSVEVSCPIVQALLEIYASVVLETPYNSFKTS